MRQLGSRYALERVVGRGATGEVWLAHETDGDGDAVAVKVLRPEYVDDGEVVARFLRERNVLRSVRSRHVVRVRDLVVEGSTLAIVMEYVPRADLRTFLRDNGGALAPAAAVALTRQILDALDAVHAAGVVHRDVKPENVLVDVDDEDSPVAKLSDFGVSRLIDGVTLTRVTGLIGTPRYMAPELASGSDPSAASDLYAVGIVLYELLTGRVPFSGEHPVAMLRAHVEQQPERPKGIDPQLWKVLAKLLAKNPSARYADAAAAMRDLDAVAPRLDGLPPLSDPRGDHTLHPTSQRRHARRSISAPSLFRRHATDPRVEKVARWQHPRLMLSTAVFAVVAMVVALFAVLLQGGSRDTGERAWIDAYKPLGYSVARDWTLTGKHGDLFTATETVLPMVATLAPRAQKYTLVVPKQLARDAHAVRINAPIVKPDPVFAVSLLAANATTGLTVRYTIRVAPKGRHSSRLDAWNDDMLRARRAFENEAAHYNVPGDVPTTTRSTPNLPIAEQHAAAMAAFTGQSSGPGNHGTTTTTNTEPPPAPCDAAHPASCHPAPCGATPLASCPPPPPTPCDASHPENCPQSPPKMESLAVTSSSASMNIGDLQSVTFTGQTDQGPASNDMLSQTVVTIQDPTVVNVVGALTPAGAAEAFTIQGAKQGTTTVHLADGAATTSFQITVIDVPPPPPTITDVSWTNPCTDVCTLTISFQESGQGSYPISGFHVEFPGLAGNLDASTNSIQLTMDSTGVVKGPISGTVDPNAFPSQVSITAFDTSNFPSNSAATASVPPPPPFTTQTTGTTPST